MEEQQLVDLDDTRKGNFVLYFLFVLFSVSGFGGLEAACLPLVPNPAEAVGFLRVNKNPQHVAGHGCLCVVLVVCCQVEVSATN